MTPGQRLAAFGVALGLIAAPLSGLSAQSAGALNAKAVRIMGGDYGSSDLRMVVDLADMLAANSEVRVVPMVGQGSARNLEDLLFLKGVDITVVQSDVLDFYRRNELIADIDQRIRYIAKLNDKEVHLLARTAYPEVDALAGARVNFGREDSGSFMASGIIFQDLGIEVDVTTYDDDEALAKLKAGEIDAMLTVDGAPIDRIAKLSPTDGVHLLSLPNDRISAAYLPAQLTTETYPQMIKSYAPVETVAVGVVLAAYNWTDDSPRAGALDGFIKALFGHFDELKAAGYHAKWQDVDLAETLPEWQRMASAEAGRRQVLDSTVQYGRYLSFECIACHHPAEADGAIPVIAALPAPYFVNALKSYRSGLRHNLVMKDVAASLDDEQIKALSVYYQSMREAEQ
ncbi:MAG: TAXI family TRAP transporter solute-binding subunit [Alphaproteobacteria bacterium]